MRRKKSLEPESPDRKKNHKIDIPKEASHLKILRAVQDDNQVSLEELGKNVGLSQSYVSRIIRQYKQSGHIVADKSILNPEVFGLSTLAFVLANLENLPIDAVQDVLERAVGNPFVQEVHRITGDFDLLLKVRCFRIDQVSSLIDSLQFRGKIKTLTITVFGTRKETLNVVVE